MRYLPRFIAWALGALCVLPALAQGTSPLTGQVQITDSIQVSTQGQSYVQLQLINCPTQHPRVILNSALTSTLVQTNSMPFYPDANGNVVGYIYPNDLLSCAGTVGHSAYQVTYVQNGVPTGSTEEFIITSTNSPFDLSANTPVTQLPPPFVAGQDFHFRNLTLDGTLNANEVIANSFVSAGGPPGTLNLAWTTGGLSGSNTDPLLSFGTGAPSSLACNGSAGAVGNLYEQTDVNVPLWQCKTSGWTQNSNGSAGVTSIDGQTGAFNFGGPGVSHIGNAYTFSGGGGGGSGSGISIGFVGMIPYYSANTTLSGDPYLTDSAPASSTTGVLAYTGGGGINFSTNGNGGTDTILASDVAQNNLPSQINLETNISNLDSSAAPGQLELSTVDTGQLVNTGNSNAANIVINAAENATGNSNSSGNVSISASNTSYGNSDGNVSITASGGNASSSGNITLQAFGNGGGNIFLKPAAASGYVWVTGPFRSDDPGFSVDASHNLHVFGDISSGVLHPGVCLEADSNGDIVPSVSGLPCNSAGGTGGTGGGTGGSTTTNQVVGSKITSETAPGKICATAAGISGSVACAGVVGTPQSITTQFGLNTPSLGTGTANAVAQLGLTVNSSANTQVLWPTTAGSLDTATVFKREMWFEAGSNLPGLDNFEVDDYNFNRSAEMDAMMGWQCNRHNTGFWQYDNFGHGWVNTAVACNIVAGHIYHFILMTHIDPPTSTACSGAPCEFWDTFKLDDITASTTNTYTLNVSLPEEAATTGNGRLTWDGSGSQVQLDVVDSSATGGSPQLVSMYLDTDTFTAYIPVTTVNATSTAVVATPTNYGEYDFDVNGTTGLTATGTPTLDNTNSYTAPNAALFNADSEYYSAPITPSASTIFARAEINVGTQTTSSTQFLGLYNGSSQIFNLFFTSTSGIITAFDQANSVSTPCGSAALSTATYHTVELGWTKGASTGSYQVLVDGVSQCNVTATNTGTQAVTSVRFGELDAPASPWTFDMDSVGFSSTGFLGPVVTTTNTATPLYDIFGAAAAVKSSSLQAMRNLSDLQNVATAQANLGLGASAFFPVLGTDTNVPTASTLSGTSQLVCTDANGGITTVGCPAGGGGGSVTLQTAGTNNGSQSALNFIASTANAAGLTVTPSNATANEKFEVTGSPTTLNGSAPPTSANVVGTTSGGALTAATSAQIVTALNATPTSTLATALIPALPYDASGAASTAQAASAQKSSNLSDVSSKTAALSNLLGNPAAGTYVVVCSSTTSCTSSSLYVYQNNGLALPTSSIAANTCTAVAGSPFTASGVTTDDKAEYAWAGDPTGVNGYGSVGGLSVRVFPGSGTVAVKVCNPNASAITPGSMSVNVWVMP